MNRDSGSVNQTFKSKLIDFSSGGLAFKSSLSNIVRFVQGDTIRIKSLKEKSIISPPCLIRNLCKGITGLELSFYSNSNLFL